MYYLDRANKPVYFNDETLGSYIQTLVGSKVPLRIIVQLKRTMFDFITK